MPYLAAAVGFLVLFLAWLVFSPPIPLTFRRLAPPRLREFLAVLFYRGFDGACLEVWARGRPERLVITKDIVADNDVHLRTAFAPDHPLAAHGQRLRGLLQSLGISADEGARSAASDAAPLEIDLGGDLDRAEHVVRELFAQLAGVDLTRAGRARLRDVVEGRYMLGWTEAPARGAAEGLASGPGRSP